MSHDTRLRDGLEPCGGPEASVAAGGTDLRGTDSSPAGTGVYAALDLGTNNCRLLIACPTGDGFRVVDSFSRIIRLGEGVSATGCISDAAIERAIAALSICRDKIHFRKAKRLRLIATEACRAASNAEGFRDRVAAETGIRLEVIDRETEAALAVIGWAAPPRPGRPRRHSVRSWRWLDRTGPDRAQSGRAGRNPSHKGLDVDPARRRYLGGAFRRQGCHRAILCEDGRGSSPTRRPVRYRAR